MKSKIPEFESLVQKFRNFALKGQYKKGTELAQKMLRTYPNEFYFKYQYAKLLGDWADDLPVTRRAKLKMQAVGILKPLTKQLAGQTVPVRFGVCLNYYYQDYAFYSMFQFGKRFLKTDRKMGLYAQALGAGLLAEQHHRQNKKSRAKRWAQKSIEIWNRYSLKKEIYYFPFYSMAMSYTILQNQKAALQSLKKAAQVSKRTVTCDEFKELHSWIKGLSL